MTSQVESEPSVLERFAPLFRPRTIAVVGASAKGGAQGNRFMRLLRQSGFSGSIYPIHPIEQTIEGLPVWRSLAETPELIDYAFIAVAAEKVPPLLAAASGRVRFAQVMSSGFGERAGGEALQRALVEAARVGGMRVLGPNCMGTYSPEGRLHFAEGAPAEGGAVGVMSQSGGLAIDLLQRGGARGLRFSGVVSLGNCADLGPNEFLEYFLADPGTRVIGAYIEHVGDGRRFFSQLREANAAKPVVILKGGRTAQGQRAVASHTGSLADNDAVWRALARQTGTVLVDSFQEFVDALVAFQNYIPRAVRPSGRVVLFGNGGGASVLGTDCLARLGLDVAPLEAAAMEALAAFDLPAGASVENPVDIPANVLQRERGAVARRILETVAAKAEPDAILVHLNLGVILGYREVDLLGDLLQATVRAKDALAGRAHVSLVLRSNGQIEADGRKREAISEAMALGLATYDDLTNQARAVAAVHAYECFRHACRVKHREEANVVATATTS